MATEPSVQKLIRLTSTSGGPLAPPELRPRLVADVEAQGSNLTDVILGILAAKYKVKFQAVKRRTIPNDTADIHLRIPLRLFRPLASNAAANDRSPQAQIIADLSQHYGLRAAPTIKHHRRTRRPAVV